jgi:hypothetical protein
MNCREFWSRMPELESGSEPLEHERQCASCAAMQERQRALAAGLQRMAAEGRAVKAPARVEAALKVAFRDRYGRSSTSAHTTRAWAWVPVAAAVMAMAVSLVWERPPRPPAVSPTLPVAALEAEDALPADSGFITLPYAEASGAADDADLVRVEVPRSTLIALGVPVADGETGEAVEADVLLGAGGAPEAVRLLP